jgi:2-hydroxychromene-2-carboxylate isomerase
MAVVLSSAALIGAGAPAGALAHGGHDRGGHHRAGWHGKRGHDRGLGRLAHELGVTKAQLKAALKTVAEQQKTAARPPSFKDLLAKQLGLTTDQVKAAAETAKSSGADTKDEWLAAFANALGVDVPTLTAAFDAARTEQKAQIEAACDAFVNALAQQLGVPAEKVAARKQRAKHH